MVRTQQELAQAVGYSRVTVSKALAGHPSVHAATRDKILAKARELGYRPNAAARTMRSGRCGAVSLVTGFDPRGICTPLPVLRGIHNALADRNLRLIFTEVDLDDAGAPDHVPPFLAELSVDGLILDFSYHLPAGLEVLLRRYAVPSVWLNRDLPTGAVYPDEPQGARLAVEHLLEHGHTRIGYLHAGPADHFSTAARRAGYEQAMARSGYRPRCWTADAGLDDPGRDLLKRMLGGTDRPTGLVLAEPAHAVALSIEAAAAGLGIGRDLSVVLIGDSARQHTGLRLTCVKPPCQRIGELAVHMLAHAIDTGDGHRQASQAVAYGPVEPGDSVGPPPAS